MRTVLSEAQWNRIKDAVPGKATDRGMTGRDNRRFVEAVLWVARTGRRGATRRRRSATGTAPSGASRAGRRPAFGEGRRLGESFQGLGR